MKKIILAIRGGGVKVPSIGVMKAMEEERIEISAYSGTSIGAIIATLGAIGATSNEILTQVQKYVLHVSFWLYIPQQSCYTLAKLLWHQPPFLPAL